MDITLIKGRFELNLAQNALMFFIWRHFRIADNSPSVVTLRQLVVKARRHSWHFVLFGESILVYLVLAAINELGAPVVVG